MQQPIAGFTYPAMPRYDIPRGPWGCAEATTSIPIKDSDNKTVASVRFGPRDFAIAKVLATAPELLETAMLAETLLRLAAETDPALEPRYQAVRQLLNEIRS